MARVCSNREKTILSIKRDKPTLKQSEVWTEKQVSKTLAKLYIAKYEAYSQEKAETFIQNLLRMGMEKLSELDEKEIEQYIREQHNSDNWGIKKTTYPKSKSPYIKITTNIIT